MKRSGHIKDSQRWSWITPNFDYCFLCWATNTALEKHEVYHGTFARQISKDQGMVISVCPRCHRLIHSNRITDRKLQAFIEKMWMQKYHKTEEDFRQLFHKSYLGEDDV